MMPSLRTPCWAGIVVCSLLFGHGTFHGETFVYGELTQPGDIVRCNEEPLTLTCDTDEVVTGEVYGGAATDETQSPLTPCKHSASDCLSIPSDIIHEINMCNWHQSFCEIGGKSGLTDLRDCLVRGHYLMAKNFRCVPRRQLFNICDSTATSLHVTEGYITSPNYPMAYPPDIDCRISIKVKAGTQLRMRIMSADLPPVMSTDGCNLDYLEIWPSDGDSSSFCGKVNYATPSSSNGWTFPMLHGGSVQLRFIAQEMHHYEGFALYFEQVEATFDVLPTTQSDSPGQSGIVNGGTSCHGVVLSFAVLEIFLLIVCVFTNNPCV